MRLKFTKRSRIDAPTQEVFDYHKRPGALERLTPPWQPIEILSRSGTIRDGDRVTVHTRFRGIGATWTIEHHGYAEGRQFRDIQIKGPFKFWQHTHRFEPEGDQACILTDEIEYEFPLGTFGQAMGEEPVKDLLKRMFDYRHATLARDLRDHRQIAAGRSLRVAVTGASGLLGRALVPLLTTGGHSVVRLVRRSARGPGEIAWDPSRGIDPNALEGVDAVVHLAGENVFGLWNEDKKRHIRDSRVRGTRALAEALAKMRRKPEVLISASAIGYYGSPRNREEVLTESSPRGEGFLAEVCEAWEAAAKPAADAGIRVAHPRIGVVLDPRGGALAKMLPAFRLGLGGRVGDGTQWISWIGIHDLLSVFYEMLFREDLRGPVNVTAPNPVTNAELATTLGKVLSRPAKLPVPEKALKLVFGDEMSRETFLASQRVSPLRLAQAGYVFRHTELEPALRDMLGR